MDDPAPFVDALLARGFTELAGVPCSTLRPLMAEVEHRPGLRYLTVSAEGEAIAYAAGAWLAGSRGVALLQNSGLGNVLNPLASLAIPYRIPVLLIMTWRGRPEHDDAAHHRPTGAATPSILSSLGIPWKLIDEQTPPLDALRWADRVLEEERRPVVLLVSRRTWAPVDDPDRAHRPAPRCDGEIPSPQLRVGNSRPGRGDVVAAVTELFADEPIVATTGYMSRALSRGGCRENHFYMQGSMGFAPTLGLGIASVRPELRVFVLDGDGALLMQLGSLATIGAAAPRNLVHIVVDNGVYASTGGQPTASRVVSFPNLVSACGYARVRSCASGDELIDDLVWAARRDQGPSLLRIAIHRREPTPLERPAATPAQITESFRRSLGREMS
ncbi:MAG: phosphonopyruvate decarboxylase [Acidobacteriota bacterium]